MLTRRLGMRVVWGLCFGGVAAVACGKSDRQPFQGSADMPGGANRTSTVGGSAGLGSVGQGGAGEEGGTGVGATGGETGEPGAPIVTITSPVGVAGPNDAGVLVEPTLDVTCKVEKGPGSASMEVAPESITVQMLDGDGNVVYADKEAGITTFATTATGTPDEYVAHLILTKVPDNGRISFVCSASDTSNPPLVGSDTVESFVDHGPIITLEDPVDKSAHALLKALRVAFTVEEAPVAKGDKGSKIDKVTLDVGGVDFTGDLTETDGVYETSVNLADGAVFAITPAGDFPITIHASDKRRPTADRVGSFSVEVDGEGPSITINSPPKDATVGGRVPLLFDVTDAISGVDQQSVVVTLNQVDHYYGEDGEWTTNGDHYVFKFDSTQIEGSEAQASINIRAKDLAGNDSPGESWLVYLDNVPPIVDLDPPNIRLWKKSGADYDCSASFDPLGVALGDLAQTQSRFAFMRALVWEETNYVEGQKFVQYSGTVESSVRIYIQPDVTAPMLVNNPGDADPDCDDIDETALKTLEFFHLTALQPTGDASFSTDDPANFPPLADFPGCIQLASADPPHLCLNQRSDLTKVIAHQAEERPPAIFALDPTNGEACTGLDFELGSKAEEGWVCVVGRAVDNAGNIGVSRPIRLCYDDPATSFTPDCMTGSTPPDCTDGCTLPTAFPGTLEDAFVFQ